MLKKFPLSEKFSDIYTLSLIHILSGNPLLEMFVEVMAHPLRRGIAAGYNIDDGNRDAFMRHNNIIQALSEHDPHKAHAAAMDHISHSLDNIRERERMRMQ